MKRMARTLAVTTLLAATVDVAGYELIAQDGLQAHAELNVRAGFRHGENVNYGLGAVRGFGSLAPVGETARDDLEFALKPGLFVDYALPAATLYGGVTVVAATTTLDGELSGQFARSGDRVIDTDSAYVGLRTATFDLSYGGQEFTVGDGFIIGDGTFNQGHDNGQYWLGAFTAWRNSAILKVNTAPLRGDLYWLRTDVDLGASRVAGLNVENSDAERWGRLGFMYFEIFDDDGAIGYDGMTAIGIRGAELHWPTLPELTLYGEYVRQGGKVVRTGAKVDADGWYIEPNWQFHDLPWRPRLSYRYTRLSGDDPRTPRYEEYRGFGFTIFKRDWDTWYQGEITGESHLFMQNQHTHMLKLKVFPRPDRSFAVWYYHHALDTPQYFGLPTHSTAWTDEVNFSFEYTPSERLFYFAGLAVAAPDSAAREVFGHGRTQVVIETFISYTFR